ncbi:MAG: selenocysteine-specific translation elongation factor [Spirochaetaceae bacterium]|nr:MAG: selenocysteine-specific translation elongation factor [Spirochaetaceae bacterium]
MHVIGTAGHVDHGKTLLIEALTGINADRLPEERRRGLTIDLGFAHFFTPGGEPVGVIDVPGHERFIRNMVAGAWSLDLALLTVAADDGWMQQSSDHTRVLRLMGVPRLIAVITKTDLASPERIAQVSEQASEACSRLGYADVPTLAVSARSGQGIDELKELILKEIASLEQTAVLEQRAAAQRGPTGSVSQMQSVAHIYVDRVFTVKGAGVVVTGSLMGGVLRRGQELLLLPQKRRVRIRSLQCYYKECETVEPTSRVAINLSGIDAGQISRGDLLSEQGTLFQNTMEFILRIASAPGTQADDKSASPKRDTEVEIAVGTGHQIVHLTRLAAGNLGRIRSSRALPLLWNQPVVLIQHGGSSILGGGRVLWLGKTGKQQRLLLSEIEPTLPAELGGEHLARLKLSLDGAVAPEEARDLKLAADPSQGTVELVGWIVAKEYRDRLEGRIRELAATPGGVRLDELATKMRGEPETLLRLAASKLAERGDLSLRGGILLPAGSEALQVSPMGRQLLRDLRTGSSRGLELSKLKIAGARKELRNLVRAGLAVALEGDIYYEKEIYLGLARSCLAGQAVGGTLTIAEAKTRTQLSRKYIIPLLNRMEKDGLVKRSGDERIITALPQ